MSKRLFFELLHEARQLRARGINDIVRKSILTGMVLAFSYCHEDINIAENMRDYQRHIISGADAPWEEN
jgi:hypothetical protein